MHNYYISIIENLLIIFIFSILSVFITNKYDFNISKIFSDEKRKPTIFYTFYLFVREKMVQIAFFFLKDYFIVTKFPDSSYFIEKKQLSFLEIIKESLPTFLILSALYLLLS